MSIVSALCKLKENRAMMKRLRETLLTAYMLSTLGALVMAFGVSCSEQCVTKQVLAFLLYGLSPFIFSLVKWIATGKGFL